MDRHIRGAAAVVAMLWLGAAGCGGSGSLSPSEFHDAALAAGCHLFVLCGELPDEATCRATQQEEPHFYASLPQLVAAGRVVYDGQKASACIDQLNALSNCNHSVVRTPAVSSACEQVVVGKVAAGGDCFFNEECVGDGSGSGNCQSAAGCDSWSQCCPGTCLAGTPTVPAGGDCGAIRSVCATGTTCVNMPGQSSFTCQPLVSTIGASCASARCASTLYCDPVTTTCQKGAARGGACNPALDNEDCDDPRDRCDPSGVCLSRIAVGAPCTSAATCVQWATCDSTLNTCVELPGLGQTCSGANGLRCLGGGSCDATTNTCTLVPVTGSCL